MTNPILVELTRGALVESVHRGAVAIADSRGQLLASVGDVDSPFYPRSSLKPIQALPLLESGAADAFQLGPEEIALACASHSGEPMHTERVSAWLTRIGCAEPDLACGAHPPRYEPVWEAMIRRGEEPTRVHNNCSGKHTGFLSVTRHWKIASEGYERHDHPVQQAVAKALGELAEATGALPWGIDGCTAPNFALPLSAFARALAKLAKPDSLTETRAKTARRIVSAMMAHPELVAGTGRADTLIMRACKGRAAVKIGAEGVFAAMLPDAGLGIAIKIDDGAARASEIAVAAVMEKLGLPTAAFVRKPVLNTRGATVGEQRPAAALVAWDPLQRA